MQINQRKLVNVLGADGEVGEINKGFGGEMGYIPLTFQLVRISFRSSNSDRKTFMGGCDIFFRSALWMKRISFNQKITEKRVHSLETIEKAGNTLPADGVNNTPDDPQAKDMLDTLEQWVKVKTKHTEKCTASVTLCNASELFHCSAAPQKTPNCLPDAHTHIIHNHM